MPQPPNTLRPKTLAFQDIAAAFTYTLVLTCREQSLSVHGETHVNRKVPMHKFWLAVLQRAPEENEHRFVRVPAKKV